MNKDTKKVVAAAEANDNTKSSKFAAGDRVAISKLTGLPDCEGVVMKKYTNSALIELHEGDAITAQIMEEMNGRYVVNYDHLKKLKAV